MEQAQAQSYLDRLRELRSNQHALEKLLNESFAVYEAEILKIAAYQEVVIGATQVRTMDNAIDLARSQGIVQGMRLAVGFPRSQLSLLKSEIERLIREEKEAQNG